MSFELWCKHYNGLHSKICRAGVSYNNKNKWVPVRHHLTGVDAYIHPVRGLRVLLSDDKLADGKVWQHLSVSCEDRLPTWEELVFAKEEFMGLEVEALQIIPKRSEHVNMHEFTLHVWVCSDGPVMPR